LKTLKQLTGAWAIAWVIALTAAAPAAVAQSSSLPDLGDSSTGAFSPVDEIRVGRKLMRRIRSSMPVVEDLELQDYLEALGTRLATAAEMDNVDLQFFLIDNSTLNAFAAPGGYIGVHTGLFLTAQTESELAAVLAHELAHVSQRHLARLIARSKDISLPAMAAMVAGLLVGGQAGAAAVIASNAAVTADNLRYTRNFEREADAIGLRTLSGAGLNPAAMRSFFGHMERWARVQELDVPEFLRTHPLTVNRIAAVESRLSQYPETSTPPRADFLFVRARIRALYAPRLDQAIAEFQANLESGQFRLEAAEKYGYALALSKATRHQEALQQIDALIADLPMQHRLQIAKANIQLAAGQPAQAVATLRAASARWPDNTWVSVALADVLLKSGQPKPAKDILEPLTRSRTASAFSQKLYARATAETGDPLRSHQAMAEYHYRRDELTAAIGQLYSAREHTADSYYEAARVEARIREIQQEKAKYGE